MKIGFLSLCLPILLIAFQGRSQTCKDLPAKYTSYEQANSKIKAATWTYSEARSTPESSWIRRISYCSCDGRTGFLLILTDSKEYIHAKFPKSMWDEFKEASSKGSYYNENVRGRFLFYP